jgi:hypothetical protein
MKKIVIFLFYAANLFCQSNLDLSAYKIFLNDNSNLTYEQLKSLNDAGMFTKSVSNDWWNALYSDSVDIKYELTDGEKELLNKNGFVVSQRLAKSSFTNQLIDVFHKDLPVFVSTDAILHAVHRSYDAILIDVETSMLIPKLKQLLSTLRNNMTAFAAGNNVTPELEARIKDLDVYLAVPLKLLDSAVEPVYPENEAIVDELITCVEDAQYKEMNFFSTVKRKIDFSQFKPRGHYVDQYRPELADYFKAMMWLGRMELYLIAPNSYSKPTKADIQRQIIISVLLSELIQYSGTNDLVNEIEKVISLFVGDQDNVTTDQISDVLNKAGIASASDLLDTNKVNQFQYELSQQPYADQKILSQVLIVNPMSPESLKPASSFMLFGQRFIIDSYVTASVVYDKIKYNELTIKRMLPSTLDILYSLGNDAALQLLDDELTSFHYSSNLAALRYQVDSFTDEFWNKSIYNNWLNSIRKLNPPLDRSIYPEFMQTAAWWQQKMNTQLASWTELRHDNLLYAKQSYTGGAVCSYPFSYVEPFPEFYESIKQLANSSKNKIQSIAFNNEYMKTTIVNYFENLFYTADTLNSIADKELSNIELTESEIKFLKRMISEAFSCVPSYNGWYTRLFYPYYEHEAMSGPDYLVADYHTAPTDAGGAMVGWVKHAGTGPVDLAILTAELPDGQTVAFVGPVSSYYEYTSTNFYRLTDDEWKDTYLDNSSRPDWTNIYLADENGLPLGEGPSLITSLHDNRNHSNLPENYLVARNYPNPFNPSTIISFSIPKELTNEKVKLSVFNIMGEEINVLVDKQLPAGNYKTKWDGKNINGNSVTSGVYFYHLLVGEQKFVGKMNLVK